MNKWQLYKLIRKNSQLKDERHPMFEKNRFMKFLGWFMYLYYAAILLFMGVILPMGMRGTYNGVAAFHILDGGMLYILMTDFWVRFVLQETPAQQVQQYALTPIRRNFLMHIYLTRSGFSLGNLYWGFLLLPFGLLAVMPLLGFSSLLSWLMGWWLLCIANGFAYLLVRTLCIRHMGWVALPALIHGTMLFAMHWPDKNYLDIPCTKFMYEFALGSLWPFAFVAAIIAFLYWINFQIQSRMVFNEVAMKEEVAMKHTTQMNFLNRYGTMGEYLKMEMKLRLRNKQVRMGFFVVLGFMVLLSGLLYFTDIYDNGFMKSFICLYDYIVLGMTTLVGIMCYEGNYIDGLMSRRESIYELLRAKYYFNSLLLLIPLILVTPLIVIGKFSIWMNLGYLFFTVGVLYPAIFQLAVYNKETLPLNQKMTGKQGNVMQQIVSVVLLFLPIGIEKISILLLGEIGGYMILIAMGLVGIFTHKLWLRNIYNRFMQRRYINMEGFRASRN